MLFVELEVLFEGLLDVLIVQNLLVDDVGQICQDHVDFGDRTRLDEVLDDFLLDAAHLFVFQ